MAIQWFPGHMTAAKKKAEEVASKRAYYTYQNLIDNF